MRHAPILVLFLLLALVATCILLMAAYTFYIWIMSRRYTRERFAFSSLTTASAITITLIATLTNKDLTQTIISVSISAINKHFSLALPTPSLDISTSEYILLVFLWSAYLYFNAYLYRNWSGQRSELQFEQESLHRRPSIYRDAKNEILYSLILNRPVDIHQPRPQIPPKSLDGIAIEVPWRIRAKELFTLRHGSTIFPEDEWHEDEKCWTGKNKHTNEMVFLRCEQSLVSGETLDQFSIYCDQIAQLRAAPRYRCVVAVCSTTNERLAAPLESRNIEIVSEEEMLTNLVDWEPYRQHLESQLRYARLPDSRLTTADVFVRPRWEPASQPCEPPESDDLFNLLDDWIDGDDRRHIALLGEYGQGKSTAAVAYAQKVAQDPNSKRMPLVIELRGMSPRNLTPLQLLGAWSAQHGLNPKALLYLHLAGKLLIIFEGFDEMTLVGDMEMRLKHFQAIWSFSSPNSKIMITGRPNFFFDTAEMTTALGIHHATAGQPYCLPVRIRPFDQDQIRLALRSYDEKTRDEICRYANDSPEFQELISRPSILYVVSILWRDEALASNRSRLTSAHVLDLFIRHSYRRQGAKWNDSPDTMALTSAERHYFMKGIAAYMAANDLPNQVTGTQLNPAIELLINSIPDSVSLDSQLILGETRDPLRDRISRSELELEHIKTDIRTCGILVDDLASPGSFRFPHKSFMEFLFADLLADFVTENRLPEVSSILSATNASLADLLSLPASTTFLAEILLRESTSGDLDLQQEQFRLAKKVAWSLGGKTHYRYAITRLKIHYNGMRSIFNGYDYAMGFMYPISIIILSSVLVSLPLYLLNQDSHLPTFASRLSTVLSYISLAAAIAPISFYFSGPLSLRVLSHMDSLSAKLSARSETTRAERFAQFWRSFSFDDKVLFRLGGVDLLVRNLKGEFQFFYDDGKPLAPRNRHDE